MVAKLTHANHGEQDWAKTSKNNSRSPIAMLPSPFKSPWHPESVGKLSQTPKSAFQNVPAPQAAAPEQQLKSHVPSSNVAIGS